MPVAFMFTCLNGNCMHCYKMAALNTVHCHDYFFLIKLYTNVKKKIISNIYIHLLSFMKFKVGKQRILKQCIWNIIDIKINKIIHKTEVGEFTVTFLTHLVNKNYIPLVTDKSVSILTE